MPPSINLLIQYTKNHPNHPYVAIVGLWDGAEHQYQYKALPLLPGLLNPTQDPKGGSDDNDISNPPSNYDPCDDNNNNNDKNHDDNAAVEITVDITINENDLTNCVYNKINNSSTFTELISNFKGENSKFNLEFKLAETDDNSFGDLGGTLPNFIAEIDASWTTTRNGIEVASTFLHEAMHAEMRRYLRSREQEKGSSIPGFPGSFTEDWNNYVMEKTGGIGEAEHEAMAQKYIGYIADGLQEYDNNELKRKYYEALAWDGLLGTKAWKNANQTEIGRNRNDDVIDERPNQCHR